jgi:hypothetical protein
MRAYLTWGTGSSKSKVLAMRNAAASAGIDKIKIKKLDKLEIPVTTVTENKKVLAKLKGEFSGIVLQNCAKGEVASALVLEVTGDKIVIGHGKAGGAIKAERLAKAEVKSAVQKENLKSEGINYHIVADALSSKGEYSCAIVALVLIE